MAALSARVLGLVGWSGSGKTTLLIKLIPLLVDRGYKVATIKHAHHAFQIDLPGKDSHAHRHAGACEVIVSSAGRWAQIHENRDDPEPTLADLLRRLSPCDLALIEGFKREPHPKLEVFRAEVGKAPLYPGDPSILALATPAARMEAEIPVIDLDDADAIAEFVCAQAQPLAEVLAVLEKDKVDGSAF